MKIDFVKSSEKELLKLDKKLAQRVLEKISLLGSDPYGQNSEKLSGGKGYRIRLGDWRIIYIVNNKTRTITIIKIGHRREVYR
jgi:mRNA interferase RelE/StbE